MQRPNWPLAINGAFFIVICLFVGGLVLSGFLHWDPCAWASALIFGGPSFALAFWQYRATFRGNQQAAKRLLFSLLAITSLLLLGIASAILEPIFAGIAPTLDYLFSVVLPMGLVASWLVFTIFLTLRWRKCLTNVGSGTAVAENDIPPNSIAAGHWRIPNFTLRELLTLVAAFSVVFAGTCFGIRDTPPKRAMHVSPKEAHLALPQSATDVCVVRGFRGTITFDFSIDEPGFREWAKNKSGSLESQADNVSLKAIKDGFTILSCSEDPNEQVIPRVINHGWYYSWHKEDRSIQYGYGTDTGRAYYHAHFH